MYTINLFDIQRCSLVDGPGLRTTVFFKGCNLRCKWCHNPESQRMEKQLLFHENRCTGCGACRRVCPNGLLSCDLCGKCADFCPEGAREIAGKEMPVEKVMKEILKDVPYYEGSGGGVTLSGGECMLQIDALEELLALCRENNIHTAVDTAGDVPFACFERILDKTSLFLYDMKCMDEALHIENTGVSNRRIKENLEKLSELCPEKLLIRIPVIPGVNTAPEEMAAMAAFLKRLKISNTELLPYHRMGEHKYRDLGLDPVTFDVPTNEEMASYKALF